jgi:hypothetical protein
MLQKAPIRGLYKPKVDVKTSSMQFVYLAQTEAIQSPNALQARENGSYQPLAVTPLIGTVKSCTSNAARAVS